MKKVYIYAYAEVNLGDDLFVHQLVRRYPDTRFVMIANAQYQSMFRSYKNVRIYDKESAFVKTLKKIRLYGSWERSIMKSCDYAVYIAGSIFMEYETWSDQHLWYQGLFDNSKLFFIGCNWGPHKTEGFYQNMRNVLRNMKDVCFRDKKSYDLFSDLENIRYAPDILFGTKFPEAEKKDQVFVSVIDCASKEEGGTTLKEYESKYLENLKKMLLFYLGQGLTIKLVSFCEKENDPKTIRRIKELLGRENENQVSELLYNGNNLDQVLSEMKASKLVIGSRFHAVILSMAANVPVIPLVYSDKTLNVLRDMDYQGMCVDIRNSADIDETKLAEVLDTWKMPEVLPAWVEESNKHFKVLDTIVY